MLEFVQGDLFESDADTLVCPVNCWGIMGAGIAKQFKDRFPENYDAYRQVCRDRKLQPGGVLTMRRMTPNRHCRIINVATKDDWTQPSTLPIIEQCLMSIHNEIQRVSARVVAIPALGCGCGGLGWRDVRQLFREIFDNDNLPHIEIMAYEPRET